LLDVLVLAEVGHEVVGGVTLGLFERCLHLGSNRGLSGLEMSLSGVDVGILSKVGHEVVHGPVGLLPGGVGGKLVPGAGSRNRSVLDSLGIAGQESQSSKSNGG